MRTCVKMIDAVAAMAQGKISELPVVDAEDRPVGLIDVTDVAVSSSVSLRHPVLFCALAEWRSPSPHLPVSLGSPAVWAHMATIYNSINS